MSPDPRLSELLEDLRSGSWAERQQPGMADPYTCELLADELVAVLLGGTPPQDEETKADPSRVGPSVDCVAPPGSTAEQSTGAVTAAERPEKAWVDSLSADQLRRIVQLERRAYDRLALCPDHRDKGNGTCIVCQAEQRTARELAASGGIASSPKPTDEPTLQNLAADLGLGALTATEVYKFLYEREQMLRMVQAELETHKSNAPTAWLALKDRIQSLRADASPTWQPIETAPLMVEVLVCYPGSYRRVAWFTSHDGWMGPSGRYCGVPTHWMPLPAARVRPVQEKE